MANEIENVRKNNREMEIIKFKQLKYSKGKCAATFHLRDMTTGNKQSSQEATTIVDPKSKEEVNSVDGIKKVCLQYCKDLLTKRAPKPEFQCIIDLKNSLHEERMSEWKAENEFDLTLEMFHDSLSRLTKKNPSKYNFILNAGKSLHDALFLLLKQVWSSEKIPEGWKKTDIVQIFKGKGMTDDLTGYRNLHTKTQERKVLGEILTHELKRKVSGNISKLQIGAMSGHRAQEHIFSIKSVIASYNMHGKGLILSLFDISKFFDREHLKECTLSRENSTIS